MSKNRKIIQNSKEPLHIGVKELKFKCDFCEKSFIRKDYLERHIIAVHDESRGHICNNCGKVLTSKRNLEDHIKSVHEGQKDFQCHFCDKAFTLETGLKQHIIRAHTGKP